MYSFEQHRHNYAVWTAARAVQRAFTSTATISAAINASCLREYAECGSAASEEEFAVFHLRCANALMAALAVATGRPVSYGRAAKIIVIYLKTAVVIASGGVDLRSAVIHPPIDGILLRNLMKEVGRFATKPWTQLEER